MEYVASTATGHSAEGALARKDRRPLPFPVRVTKESSTVFDRTIHSFVAGGMSPRKCASHQFVLLVAHPLVGVLHVHTQSELPDSIRVGPSVRPFTI